MKTPEFFYKHAGLGSLVATATNAVAIFLVFRLAYRELGAPVVGIWALTQSIMVISRIGDSGSGGNITRLIAIDRGKQGGVALRNFIAAGIIVGTAPIAALGAAIFLPAFFYLAANYAHQLPSLSLSGLITCSLLFGICNSVAMILSGCLDGLGLMALRGFISSVANIAFVIFGYIFIRNAGDLGLGLAYVAYAIFLSLLMGLGIWLFRPKPQATYQPQPVRELIRKSAHFNTQFLFIGLLKLLLDPISKLLIGRFGTLELIAMFDLANKFASLIIVLFSSALQSLLPAASRETRAIDPAKHAEAMGLTKLAVRWAFCIMTLLVLGSGYLSLFTLGHLNGPYLQMQFVLALGAAINPIGLVGYYIEVGSGHLKRLVGVFAGCAGTNVALGLALGMPFGAIGVSAAYMAAWIFGGLACSRPLFSDVRALFRFLLSAISVELTIFTLAGMLVFFVWNSAIHLPDPVRSGGLFVYALVCVGVFLYRGGAEFLRRYAASLELGTFRRTSQDPTNGLQQ